MGVEVGPWIGDSFEVAIGVGVGIEVGVGVGADVAGAATAVAADVPSENDRLLWLFRADAEKLKASGPAEIPVTCQLTVVLPPAPKLPTFTVGELTEKWPFWELSDAEMLDNVVYVPALTTSLSIAALTVAV